MSTSKRLSLLFLPCILLLTNSAKAQLVGVVDREAGSTYSAVSDGDTLIVPVDAASSYCCEVIRVSDPGVFFSTASVALTYTEGSSTVTGRFAGADAPRTSDGQARLCFIVPPAVSLPQATLTIGVGGAGTATDVPILCSETTLYGGFNTSVTDFNFLEMTNTLENVTTPVDTRTINGKLTAVNVVPNPDVVLINAESFSVAAGTRSDIDIHSRAGSGAFGSLKLVHDGAPGALKAVLSQYNITATSPLDFSPVAQDQLRTRSDIAGPTK